MREKAINALIELGANPSTKGFIYTVDAIDLINKDIKILNRMTTLYVTIAGLHKDLGATSSRVERAIRHLHEGITLSSNLKTLEKYVSLQGDDMCNGKFISTLYYRLKGNTVSTQSNNNERLYTESEVLELVKLALKGGL